MNDKLKAFVRKWLCLNRSSISRFAESTQETCLKPFNHDKWRFVQESNESSECYCNCWLKHRQNTWLIHSAVSRHRCCVWVYEEQIVTSLVKRSLPCTEPKDSLFTRTLTWTRSRTPISWSLVWEITSLLWIIERASNILANTNKLPFECWRLQSYVGCNISC
jgi:hypothetical protein